MLMQENNVNARKQMYQDLYVNIQVGDDCLYLLLHWSFSTNICIFFFKSAQEWSTLIGHGPLVCSKVCFSKTKIVQ